MKEFKVYVGMSEDNMTEVSTPRHSHHAEEYRYTARQVLHAALRNDSMKETFTIRHCNNAGVCFPTRYVKIVPLS